jgi:ABC-type phosphate/phosphonate transport system substrate-binding protein
MDPQYGLSIHKKLPEDFKSAIDNVLAFCKKNNYGDYTDLEIFDDDAFKIQMKENKLYSWDG